MFPYTSRPPGGTLARYGTRDVTPLLASLSLGYLALSHGSHAGRHGTTHIVSISPPPGAYILGISENSGVNSVNFHSESGIYAYIWKGNYIWQVTLKLASGMVTLPTW